MAVSAVLPAPAQTPGIQCDPIGDPILDGMIPLSGDQLRQLIAEGVDADSGYIGTIYDKSGSDAICYRYVDLSPAGECGAMEGYASPEPQLLEDDNEPLGYRESGGNVEALSILWSRTQEFPTLLKGLGRWNAETAALTEQLNTEFLAAQAIINGDKSPEDKSSALEIPFGRAGQLTRALATMAGVNYQILGGCGADEEDSQVVTFSISPKANYARYILQYDFELCEALVDDPYNANKCDAWHVMSPGEHFLSGNYRYRVIWPDGEPRDDTESFTGIGNRTYRIER